MDYAIEFAAANYREAARNDLQMLLDRWRLELGMVEVVTVPDPPIYRTLRHKRDGEGRVIARPGDTVPEGVRLLPLGNGYAVFIQDVEATA